MSKLRSLFSSFASKARHFTLSTPVAIILASLILGGSHIVYGLISQSTPGTQTTSFTGKPIDGTDYVEGKTNSKVVVVEYSDPECPYCISLHPTMKQLRTDYGDKIAFVYRHFPLTQIHPHAYDEAKAIACAGTLGGKEKYYEYIDALFGYKAPLQTQQNPSPQLPASGKEDIAKNVGLDSAAFKRCEEDQATATAIDSSINDGIQAGVQGTPSSFVLLKEKKGYKVIAFIDGARQYEYFKAAIDQALAE